MGTKTSQMLLEYGFFWVLGTTQRSGGSPEGTLVERGTPHTFDCNNGILVIYDEEGRPWIHSSDTKIPGVFVQKLRRGAHVPHSNDGGYFFREVVNKL